VCLAINKAHHRQSISTVIAKKNLFDSVLPSVSFESSLVTLGFTVLHRFQQYREDIRAGSIRSAGFGTRVRSVNNSVKTISVGGSASRAVQPVFRRLDFMGTSRKKRRDALVQFGTEVLHSHLGRNSEGGSE